MKLRSGLMAICFLATLFCGCGRQVYMFTSFHEPAVDGLHLLYSYDGFKWDSLPGVWLRPELGEQSLMRDPSIVKGPDGTFHLVWTTSWRGDKGFGYSSSKDLIHWTPQKMIPVMVNTATNNVWAPELFYDDVKQQYLIAWSSAIPDQYPDDLPGEASSHRQYYTTTKDFVTFTPEEPFYNPGFNSIDGAIVKRGADDYVLVIKDNRKPGYSDLFTVFAKSPEGPYSNPSVKFGPEYSEGPTVVKIGDEWIIYFDVYRQFRYGAVSTKDFRTFTDISDKISIPKGHKHGTIFMTSEKVLKRLKKAKR